MIPVSTETAACAAVLRHAGAVALVPTETVYGLVCRWDDAAAREKIYTLKGRDREKPLAMFVADAAMAEAAGAVLNPAGKRLLERFAPGPVTVIVPDNSGSTIGIRIPDYPLILAVLRELNFPLASTSANASGMPNARTVEEALRELHGKVDLAVDHGAIPEGRLASTVILATGPKIKILRPGPVTEAMIREALAVLP